MWRRRKRTTRRRRKRQRQKNRNEKEILIILRKTGDKRERIAGSDFMLGGLGQLNVDTG